MNVYVYEIRFDTHTTLMVMYLDVPSTGRIHVDIILASQICLDIT